MAAMSLSFVLEAIQLANIPTSERRRLGARAVEAALRPSGCRVGEPVSESSAVEPRLHLEEALVAVQEVACTEAKLNVGKATGWLREQGSPRRCLAGRLGRLSKARNATLHPDVSLLRDIRRLSKGAIVARRSLSIHLLMRWNCTSSEN